MSVFLSLSLEGAVAASLPAGGRGDVLRHAIDHAIRRKLVPAFDAPLPERPVKVSVHLTDTQASYVRRLVADHGSACSFSRAVVLLALAGLADRNESQGAPSPSPSDARAADSLSRVLGLLGLDPAARPEQRAIYEHIKRALVSCPRPIVPAQASTGVGKTAIAQAIAMDWAGADSTAHFSGVTVLAFPSLIGVKTFAAYWHAARQADASIPQIATLFGRPEFVSRIALNELLANPAEVAAHLPATSISAIRKWAAAQESIPADALVRAWMMDSLLTVEDRLDRHALCLTPATPSDDPGLLSYLGQFERARGVRVIVCSHAMLALDVLFRYKQLCRQPEFRDARRATRETYFSPQAAAERDTKRDAGVAPTAFNQVLGDLLVEFERAISESDALEGRRLPAFDHLIVDEAHLLEQAFASAFSSTLSLRDLLRTLRRLAQHPWPGAKKALERAASTVARNIDLLTSSITADEVELGTDSEAAHCALKAFADCHSDLSSIRLPKDGTYSDDMALASLKLALQSLRFAVHSRSSLRVLSFSPIRRFPNLLVGSGDVSVPLNMLWSAVNSAVLLSATLYMPKGDGWSSRYQASLLSLPMDRLVEVPVVHADWVIRPVQAVYTPAPVLSREGDSLWLRPPSRRDKLSFEAGQRAGQAWLRDLALAIAGIYRTAAGGVMVACTSHDTVAQLSGRLQEILVDRSVICSQARHMSLGAVRSSALDAVARGQRPLLIGTGGLWTGFDLSGQMLDLPPERDNVVTDLVIPRLPFGMNRTLTHRRRVSDPRQVNIPHEMLSAALLLQQGLGRLVRREGLPPNRRIFILDGRLADSSFDTYFTACRRVYSAYPVRVFAPDDPVLSDVYGTATHKPVASSSPFPKRPNVSTTQGIQPAAE